MFARQPNATEYRTIQKALRVLDALLRDADDVTLRTPSAAHDYLRLRLAGLEYEVFMVLFLDSRHRLIEAREMFRGTLTQTAVYPREVVKAALATNAAAVILAHNHPSGVAEPSMADQMLTETLRNALALVDVSVLDHVVVAGRTTGSFAERGWL